MISPVSALLTLFAITVMQSAAMHSDEAVLLAKQTLSQLHQLDEKAMEVEHVKDLQWSDSSLGCPQPGMMYTQVITEGYKVMLKVEGRHYAVHIGGSRAIVCESKSKAFPLPKLRR